MSSPRFTGDVIARFAGPRSWINCWQITDFHALVPISPVRYTGSAGTSKIGNSPVEMYTRSHFEHHTDLVFYAIRLSKEHTAGYLSAVYRSEPGWISQLFNIHYGANTKEEGGPYEAPGDLLFEASVYADDHLLRHCLRSVRLRQGKALPVGEHRRYRLIDLRMQEARFDGAAGALACFPTAPFELVQPEEHCLELVAEGNAGSVYGLCRAEDGLHGWWNCVCRWDGEKLQTWTDRTLIPSSGPCVIQGKIFSHQESGVTSVPEFFHQQRSASVGPSIKEEVQIASSCEEEFVCFVAFDLSSRRSSICFLRGKDMREAFRLDLPYVIPASYSHPVWIDERKQKRSMSLGGRSK